jgi:hypothetical protein
MLSISYSMSFVDEKAGINECTEWTPNYRSQERPCGRKLAYSRQRARFIQHYWSEKSMSRTLKRCHLKRKAGLLLASPSANTRPSLPSPSRPTIQLFAQMKLCSVNHTMTNVNRQRRYCNHTRTSTSPEHLNGQSNWHKGRMCLEIPYIWVNRIRLGARE